MYLKYYHTDHSSLSLPFFLEPKKIYATTHKQTKQKNLREFQNVNKQSRVFLNLKM